MTIRITVKNEDSRQGAIVIVKEQDMTGKSISGANNVELRGGDSVDKYVHSGKRLVVEEVSNCDFPPNHPVKPVEKPNAEVKSEVKVEKKPEPKVEQKVEQKVEVNIENPKTLTP